MRVCRYFAYRFGEYEYAYKFGELAYLREKVRVRVYVCWYVYVSEFRWICKHMICARMHL